MTTSAEQFAFAVRIMLRRRGKYAFLRELAPGAKILDVGCGNDSPYNIKTLFPALHYTGIDVQDYNQTKPMIADAYVIASPESFPDEIARFKDSFDAVISSHNIEHCNDANRTLTAMLDSVRAGGRIFLAFPTERSTQFPRRTGTLNYFDDPGHARVPPSFDHITAALKRSGFDVEYEARQYRPMLLRALGMMTEPFSRMQNRVLPGTWEYYGFESIIWAAKRA